MSLKNLFSSAGGASSDVIETEVVSTASIRDVFEDNSCVALYRFEGDATDTSGNFNGTASNLTYGTGKFGQCGVFNGSSSYVNIYLQWQRLSTFSLSIWVKPTVTPTGYQMILNNRNIATDYMGALFYTEHDGKISFLGTVKNGSWTDTVLYKFGAPPVGGAWTHYVVVKNGGTLTAYTNGVLTKSGSCSTAGYTLTDCSVIGSNMSAIGGRYTGSIDQVRIFNRALTQEEVTSLYAEEKTVVKENVRELKDLVDPFLDKSGIALYKMDGNAQDAGGVYNGTPTNMSYTSGKFGDCATFTGDASKYFTTTLTLPAISSVSYWVKRNSSLDTGNVQAICGINGDYFNCGSEWVLLKNSATWAIRLSGGEMPVSDSGVWHHICFTDNGSKIDFFVDGVKKTNIGTYASLSGLPITQIGKGGQIAGSTLNGQLDQLRIFNRVLTAEEVAVLYAEKKPQVSTINLTDPFGDNSAVALYKMDGNALDVGGSYNGTASGVTYEEGKFGHCAVFNGTSANINTGYNYGSLFAVSVWVKTTSSGWVASSYTSDTAGGGLTVEANVAKLEFGGGGGVIRTLYGTKVVNDGAWHHIVALSDGTIGTIYVDGVLDVSSPFVHYNSSGNIYLGKRGTIANYFSGKMDQVRLFKRMLSQEEVEILYNEKPNDTTEEGLVAYYPLQVSAQDAQSTFEGTATNVAFDGDSAYFNGTSSQISVPSIVSKFNTQSIFGVSLWFKGTQTSVPVGLFSVRNLASESVIFLIALNRTVAGELALDVGTSGNFIILGKYNGMYNNGEWHHVYADIDFTTKAFNLYADGVKIAGGVNASMLKSTSASNAYIGCNYLSQYFAGNLDEVRVYERALTAQEVSDLYNNGRHIEESLLPSIPQTGLVSYYSLDTDAKDSVGFLHGTATAVTFSKEGAYFNGTNATITLPLPNDINGACSVSFWVNRVSDGESNSILSTVSPSSANWINIHFPWQGSTEYYDMGNTANGNRLSRAFTRAFYNTWKHIAVCGDSFGLKVYMDGMLILSNATPVSINTSTISALQLMRYTNTMDTYACGYIKRFGIYRRALTAQEVSDIYNYGR